MKTDVSLETAVPAPGGPAARGTRIRFRVAALGTTLAMVTYLDRVSMGTIAPIVTREWQLTPSQTGWIFSAFALAYAIFEIPTAKWAEKLGTKSVLTRIVLWWSAFTAATALAFNLPSMLLVRFLFGAGEAGAWPMAARAFSSWIPRLERGDRAGHLLRRRAPGGRPDAAAHRRHARCYMSWRMVFVVFGLVGLVWVAAWRKWFKNDPTEHPEVNAAELAHILHGRPPDSKHTVGREYWGRLFFSRNVVLLCLMYLSNSTIFYFCITWLPTYLRNRHGFDATHARLSLRPAAARQRAERSVRRHAQRSAVPASTACAWAGASSARSAYALDAAFLFLAASSTTPIVAAVSIAIATGSDDADAGGGVEHVHRGRAQSRGRGRRGDEHLGPGRQPADSARRRLLGGVVQQLGLSDLHARRACSSVGTVCWLLIDPHKPVFDEHVA